MDALVFDTDSVNTHFLRYKLDAVVSLTQVDDITDLGDSGRTGDGGLHVIGAGAWNSIQEEVRGQEHRTQ